MSNMYFDSRYNADGMESSDANGYSGMTVSNVYFWSFGKDSF